MDYSYLSLFPVVAASFISTNIDNLVILTVLKSSRPGGRIFTSAGYLLACAIVVSMALLVALAGGSLDGKYVGFLGIVPAVIGLRSLLARWRNPEDEAPEERTFDSAASAVVGTGLLMLGNSGDSLALLLPLFLDTHPEYYPFLVLCYAVFATLWLLIANRITASIDSGPFLR